MLQDKRGWGEKSKKVDFSPQSPKLIILLAILNSPLLTNDFSLPGVRQPTLGAFPQGKVSHLFNLYALKILVTKALKLLPKIRR